MKKILVSVLMAAMFAVPCLAASVTNVDQTATQIEAGLPRIEFYDQVNDQIRLLCADMSNVVTQLNLLMDNRQVVGSKNAATKYVVESGSSTGTAVIAFTTPFSANPQIIVYPTVRAAVDVTSNAVIVVNGTQSQTNFTTSFAAGTTFNWLAIGPK